MVRKELELIPVDFVKKSRGVWCWRKFFLNSIDKDGTYSGYDIELIKNISNIINIPLIACGGAGKIEDF